VPLPFQGVGGEEKEAVICSRKLPQGWNMIGKSFLRDIKLVDEGSHETTAAQSARIDHYRQLLIGFWLSQWEPFVESGPPLQVQPSEYGRIKVKLDFFTPLLRNVLVQSENSVLRS